MKKNILTLSVIAALGSNAYANLDSFIQDTDLNLSFKNQYKKADTSSSDSEAWGQNIQLDVTSGMFHDIFSVNASLFHAFKLKADDNESDVGMFPISNGKAQNFGKFAYTVNAHINENARVNFGRQHIDTPLFRTLYIDLMPELSEAFTFNYTHEAFDMYGIYATKFSNAISSGFDNLGSANDKDAVQILGGSFNAYNSDFSIAYGRQNDYATQGYAEVHHMMPTKIGSIHLGGQVGMKSAIGDQKDTLAGGEDAINWYGLKAGYKFNNNMGLSFAWVDVSGKYEDEWDNAGNLWNGMELASTSYNDGRFVGYTSGVISDFANSGQQSKRVSIDYDFSDHIPGLNAAVSYIKSDIESTSGIDISDDEFNFHVSYEIPEFYGTKLNYVYADNKLDTTGTSEVDSKKHQLSLSWSMNIM